MYIESPLGDPIPLNVDTFNVRDEMPEDAEIRDVEKVVRLVAHE